MIRHVFARPLTGALLAMALALGGMTATAFAADDDMGGDGAIDVPAGEKRGAPILDEDVSDREMPPPNAEREGPRDSPDERADRPMESGPAPDGITPAKTPTPIAAPEPAPKRDPSDLLADPAAKKPKPTPMLDARGPDYYDRRAAELLKEDITKANLLPHPLMAKYPDSYVVVCTAGCRTANGAAIVGVTPKAAATPAPGAADPAVISCVGGCGKDRPGMIAAAPAAPETVGEWMTTVARVPGADAAPAPRAGGAPAGGSGDWMDKINREREAAPKPAAPSPEAKPAVADVKPAAPAAAEAKPVIADAKPAAPAPEAKPVVADVKPAAPAAPETKPVVADAKPATPAPEAKPVVADVKPAAPAAAEAKPVIADAKPAAPAAETKPVVAEIKSAAPAAAPASPAVKPVVADAKPAVPAPAAKPVIVPEAKPVVADVKLAPPALDKPVTALDAKSAAAEVKPAPAKIEPKIAAIETPKPAEPVKPAAAPAAKPATELKPAPPAAPAAAPKPASDAATPPSVPTKAPEAKTAEAKPAPASPAVTTPETKVALATPPAAEKPAIAAPAQEKVISVLSEDKDMNRAIQKSRSTLADFWKSYDAPGAGESDHALKVAISGNGSTEHFWLTRIKREGDKFTGLISNQPQSVKTVKMGQRFTFTSEMISDWTFKRNGKLVGNETMRVLLPRMPEEQAAVYRQMYETP